MYLHFLKDTNYHSVLLFKLLWDAVCKKKVTLNSVTITLLAQKSFPTPMTKYEMNIS